MNYACIVFRLRSANNLLNVNARDSVRKTQGAQYKTSHARSTTGNPSKQYARLRRNCWVACGTALRVTTIIYYHV